MKIQRNAIIDDHVLPGSIFKVFGLAAGLENGETLNSVFSGRSPVTIDGCKTMVIVLTVMFLC